MQPVKKEQILSRSSITCVRCCSNVELTCSVSECEMANCTNASNCTDMEGPQGNSGEFEAFGFLIASLGGLTFVLSVPTCIAVCTTHELAKGLRMYLMSTLVAGLLISAIGILVSLIVVVTVFSDTPPPPLLLCRFALWLYRIFSAARSFSVAGYSIMVLVIVRYGQRVKTLYIVLSLCVVWGLSILLCIQYLVPQLYAVSYFAGAVCLPVKDGIIIPEAFFFFAVFGFTITSLVPVVVCLVVPCIVLRYIKKHSLTAESDYNKPVAKLALFLVTGTSINSVATITISVLLVSFGNTAGIYSSYIIALVSLYPAPILIIAFLKPVRYRMKTLLNCRMCNVCHDRYPMLL